MNKVIFIALLIIFLFTSVAYAEDLIIREKLSKNTINTDSFPKSIQRLQTVSIGDGTDTSWYIPSALNMQSSMTETIYLDSEINLHGLLSGLSWSGIFSSDLFDKYVRIWVGTTNMTDLYVGWIHPPSLSLVYDDLVNFPIGESTITVPFQYPFAYNGGNLVILVLRPYDSNPDTTFDSFFVTETSPGRTREFQSNFQAIDPITIQNGNMYALIPNVELYFDVSLGTASGIVSSNGIPLSGATVQLEGGLQNAPSDSTGHFQFGDIVTGTYSMTAKRHDYEPLTQQVNILENTNTTVDFSLTPMLQVTVTGHVAANDNTGICIRGAVIELSGYNSYSRVTDVNGDFVIHGVTGNQTYHYYVSAEGFSSTNGSLTVSNIDIDVGNLYVTENLYSPVHAVAEDSGTMIGIHWSMPNSSITVLDEDFEDTFVPDNWSQLITNTGETNSAGVYPSWCQIETVAVNPPIVPHSGNHQVGLCWSYNHQDEWLITPQFQCPPFASLSFWSYCRQGSIHGDHYYVKVSQDNGLTWSVLWDASALDPALNCYSLPYIISLEAYEGQNIKIAWNAVDGSGLDGLYYDWFIDDVIISDSIRAISFQKDDGDFVNSTLLTSFSKNTNELSVPMINKRNGIRSLIGYRVYRLFAGAEDIPATWTLLTIDPITSLNCYDLGWNSLLPATYVWAIRAVYTGNFMSSPCFTNHIRKYDYGLIIGSVKSAQAGNPPICGARITVGNMTTISNESGIYLIRIPVGNYTVFCEANMFETAIQSNVIVESETEHTVIQFQLHFSDIIFTDGFETYPDFATTFHPWQVFDYDGSITYGLPGVNFPGMEEPSAFEIMNPGATTPPLDNAITFSGSKYAACFADVYPQDGTNNDWLISPQVRIGASGLFSFWARSFNSTFGLERIHVGISNSGTQQNEFTLISGEEDIIVPTDWTEYIYDLSGYANSNIYIGIQCVSSRSSALSIDDFSVSSHAGSISGIVTSEGNPVQDVMIHCENTDQSTTSDINGIYHLGNLPNGMNTLIAEKQGYSTVNSQVMISNEQEVTEDISLITVVPVVDPGSIPIATCLQGNFPNPFKPTTIIKYSVKQTAPVSITIFNLKGQKVKTLVNEFKEKGHHLISWNGTDDNNKAVSSGVYFYKMKAGTYSSTKKMILMK